jgi:hypothetical protein
LTRRGTKEARGFTESQLSSPSKEEMVKIEIFEAGKPVMRLLQKVLVLGQQTIILLIFAEIDPYSDIVLHMPGNDRNDMHIATRD